jgi:hypothetical protein
MHGASFRLFPDLAIVEHESCFAIPASEVSRNMGLNCRITIRDLGAEWKTCPKVNGILLFGLLAGREYTVHILEEPSVQGLSLLRRQR